MYVKNFTSSNLTLNRNGNSIVLTANATTLIPDGLVTIAELQQSFGKQAVAIDASGSGTTSIMTNQQVVETGKLYLTAPSTVTGDVRVFIGNGASVDVYGSDDSVIPSAYTSMNCPEENLGVSGVLSFAVLPRYIAFKVASGTPRIVVTNLKLLEVGTIS